MAKILFIAPWFQYKPVLPLSLILQTEEDWQLFMIHDGPIKEDFFYWNTDPRISVEVSLPKNKEPGNQWGHPIRARVVNKIVEEKLACDWIVHTNADNYYPPGFCEMMLEAGTRNRSDLVYCDMVHNHKKWVYVKSLVAFGQIDCGAVMVRADWVKEAGWPSRRFEADWDYIAEVYRRHPRLNSVHVPSALLVHN